MIDTFEGFADLDEDPRAIPVAKKQVVKYPCVACGGTGNYRGVRIHQPKSNCFACAGKGYFKTSPEARLRAKQKRVARKNKKSSAFMEANKDLYAWLCSTVSWNDFASSLVEQVRTKGELSDKQLAAAKRMKDKVEATRKAKTDATEKAIASAPVVDLTKIHDLFAVARGNGLKRPVLRVGELQISMAPATGVNAGYLYVKDSGNYAGKLNKDGGWISVARARATIADELVELAKDPAGLAKVHGRKTGECACCGRELTKHSSIELGIGPICAERWGF